MKIKKLKLIPIIIYSIIVGAICYGATYNYINIMNLNINSYIIILLILTGLYPLYRLFPYFIHSHHKSVPESSFHSEKMILKFRIDGCEYKIGINEIDFSDKNRVLIKGELFNECNCEKTNE